MLDSAFFFPELNSNSTHPFVMDDDAVLSTSAFPISGYQLVQRANKFNAQPFLQSSQSSLRYSNGLSSDARTASRLTALRIQSTSPILFSKLHYSRQAGVFAVKQRLTPHNRASTRVSKPSLRSSIRVTKHPKLKLNSVLMRTASSSLISTTSEITATTVYSALGDVLGLSRDFSVPQVRYKPGRSTYWRKYRRDFVGLQKLRCSRQ
jgi:hypothetical protein